MGAMFSHFLSWLVGFALQPLFFVLWAFGLLMPSCEELGVVQWSSGMLNNTAMAVRFLWPFIRFVPWELIWNILSAFVLYALVKWAWSQLPFVMNLSKWTWLVIACLYVILPIINFFITNDWMDSTMFTEVFGESPTSTGGFEGGGFGGGGGGSW